MKFRYLLLLICLGLSLNLYSQEPDLSINSILPQLLSEANSVLRDEQITIYVEAVDKMTITTPKGHYSFE